MHIIKGQQNLDMVMVTNMHTIMKIIMLISNICRMNL